MRQYCFRLTRGADLLGSIRDFAAEKNIKAAVPIACVGCVSRWRIRAADGKTAYERAAPAEIVSLTGTVSRDGCHLHISLAGEDLSVIGGHLLQGCIINTTAEIVLAEVPGYRFSREADPETGYRELVITEV